MTRTLFVLLACFCTAFLAGCGADSSSDPSEPTVDPKPESGQVATATSSDVNASSKSSASEGASNESTASSEAKAAPKSGSSASAPASAVAVDPAPTTPPQPAVSKADPAPLAKPAPAEKAAPEPEGTPVKATAEKTDWIGWGGKLSRNMVDLRNKNMPTEFDVESGLNIKWVAELGSQTYGNPSIVDGKVYIGTNNESNKDPEITGDRGNILCFREEDGKFLWQAVHDKLEAGRVNDWPNQGVCSAPWIEGDRFWYFNNRAEIICADTEGFLDGENDGMQDEQYKGETKADIVWSYDTIEELGNFPHNLATSSPLVWSNFVYVVTGNGVDEGHLNLPIPDAPSFIAVHKETGELVWEYICETNVLHGQWSSPAMGQVDGQWQIYMPGGDGLLYAFEPATGELIWKFDLNPKDSKWELGGYGTRNNIISTPVFHEGFVYLGVGQDPEHGTGIGHFYKIDPTGKGDVTKTHGKWHIGGEDFGRTMSTAAVHDGLVYISDLEGYLYCLSTEDGSVKWKHDLQAAVWGSPMVVDGKVYMGDEDGEVVILEAGPEKKVIGEFELESSSYCTPVPANGVLYIVSKSKLYAIQAE